MSKKKNTALVKGLWDFVISVAIIIEVSKSSLLEIIKGWVIFIAGIIGSVGIGVVGVNVYDRKIERISET